MANYSVANARSSKFKLTVTSDGAPFDLTGAILHFVAKSGFGGTPVFRKKSPNNGIVIDDVAGGLATLTISPADTASIPGSTQTALQYELAMGVGADIYQLESGTLTILPSVGAVNQ